MRLLRKDLLKDRAGNTAMIFALLTPVLVLLGGGAIDVTNASMRQSNLQQAADAAAVGAVARSSPAYQAALLMTGDGTVTATNLQPNAQAIFSANRRNSGDTTTPNLTVAVAKTGLTVSSTVTATSTFTPSFLELLSFVGLHKMSSIALSASAYASDNIPAYINFYMLLDNTPSMGLGATSADITALQNMTANAPSSDKNCAFACHTTQDAAADFFDQARALGPGVITLRIDEVATATANLMRTATQTETQNGLPPPPIASGGPACSAATGPTPEFNVAIYDFGDQAFVAPAVKTVSSLQTCLTQSAADAASVQLETVPTNNNAYIPPYVSPGLGPIVNNNDTDTDFTNMLGNMATTLGVAGTGANATSPQKILFFVTDGMTDSPVGVRTLGGIDNTACTSMKNNGVKIAILYTTYLQSAIANDPSQFSQDYVIPTLPTVSPALQACASPGLFYEVNPNNGAITTAMNALFQNVLASVHINK